MPASRRAGGVTKRCECRGADGKRLGQDCPQLSKRSHGTHQVRQELAPDEDGRRRTFRRTGYATGKDANTDLSRVQAILDLADEDDEDAQRRVSALLMDVMRDRRTIPEAVEVSRKLGVGVPLDGKMTVGEWLDVWLAAKKTRSTTNNSYRSHIEYHLKPHLGHLRLDKLGVGHLVTMFDAIAEESETTAAENMARAEQKARARWTKPGRPPVAARAKLAEERAKLAAMKPYRRTSKAATWKSIRRTLNAALNAAIGRQLITFNAAMHVEMSGGGRPKAMLWTEQHVERWRKTGIKPSAVMVWTPTQTGAFLDAAETHRLYAFFHLVAFRGLRRGEGVGQDWVHVDLDGRRITIAKAITVDGWTPVEGDPKTDGSAATIALGPLTAQVLREHKVRQEAEREAWNAEAAEKRAAGDKDAPLWAETGKVFVDVDGSWLHPEKVSDAFREICRRADLPPINLRDLRHVAATLIHAGGGDIFDIKETLRHSSIKLAGDTYTSLLEEVDQEIAAKSEGAVPRARKPEPEPEPDGGEPDDRPS